MRLCVHYLSISYKDTPCFCIMWTGCNAPLSFNNFICYVTSFLKSKVKTCIGTFLIGTVMVVFLS